MQYRSRPTRRFALKPLALAFAQIGLLGTLSAPLPLAAQQLPTGGTVTHGSATIKDLSGTRQRITQTSDKAIIDWQGFSIGPSSSVRFVQPGAGSVVLNRVIGSDPSSIFGALSANGQVFLVNPHGIYFSPTATLDVGGLLASTLNIRNQDFLDGRYVFTRDPASRPGASVINEGHVIARPGGYVVLAGDYAANRGVIEAAAGTIALASGSRVTLDFHGDGLVNLAVNEKALGELAGVANAGEIIAEGGRVVMTAAVARDLAGTVVNNTGVVRATGTVQRDGAIYLVGEGGDVNVSGRLDARGARGGNVTVQAKDGTTLVSGSIDAGGTAGRGGSVQILGERVGLVGDAAVVASGTTGGGTVLVGGDFQGRNPQVQNAERTYVGADATINADATRAGDGGKVIVWADDTTRYYGEISARGGSRAGDGGLAEVSGKGQLAFDGKVDLSAPKGRAGTLLLDPTNIVISATGATAPYTDVNAFAAGTGTETIDPAALNAVGASVVLEATNDITVAADGAINLTTAGAGLTARAGHDITVGASITTNNGAILLSAGDAGGTVVAGATLSVGGALASGGADITLQNTQSGGVNITRSLTAGAGTVRIASTGGGVTQTGTGTNNRITADRLGVIAAGPVVFRSDLGSTSHNSVNTFAAEISGANNGISYTDRHGGGQATLTIGSVPALAGTLFNSTASGVTTNNGAVTLTAGKIIQVNSPIAAGTGVIGLRTTEDLAPQADIVLNANVTSSTRVVLNSADAITQTAGGITTPQLVVRAASGGSDDAVSLTGANNVGTVAAEKNDPAADGSVGGIHAFTLNNGANALTVGSIAFTDPFTNAAATVNGITANPGDALVDTPSIPGIVDFGKVTLTSSTIAVNAPINTGAGSGAVTLQPLAGASTSFGGATHAHSVSQAEVNQITSGSLRVGRADGAGALVVDGAITATANVDTFVLRAGTAGVSQTQAITAGGLGVETSGAAVLTNAGNAVGAFGANLTGAGSLQFDNSTGFTVGLVGAIPGTPATAVPGFTVSGITTAGTNVTLNSGNTLALDASISAGAGAVSLDVATGGISQTAGGITASGLQLLGTGNFNVDQTANSVGTLAANVDGGLSYAEAGAVSVGTVGATSGITTTGGVQLTVNSLDVAQNITAGGAITLTTATANRTINLGSPTGGLDLTTAELDRLVTASTLTFGDDAHTGQIVVGGAAQTIAPASATGGITLRNRTGGIAVNGILDPAGAGGVTLIADGNANRAGAITQGASGGIVANTLSTRSAGGTSLSGSGNQVANFSALETGGGSITLNNIGALQVSSIATGTEPPQAGQSSMTMQNVTVTTTGNLSVAAAGINTQNLGDPGADPVIPATPNASSSITLTSSGGSVTLNGDLAAGSSGTVALSSATGVTQPGGEITGSRLRVLGTGGATLNQAGNDVGTIAANVGGNFAYRDANTFAVGTVAGTSGITTSNDSVTLRSGNTSAIAINQGINAGSSTVTLTVSGVAQSSSAAAGITAAGLRLQDPSPGSSNTYSLTSAGNDVGSFSADVRGAVTYTDASGFIVTPVAGGTTGINTRGFAVTLNSGNTITLVDDVNAGGAGTGGTVTFNTAAGGVDQQSGSILSSAVRLTGTGDFILNQPGNNTTTLAADVTGDVTFREAGEVFVGTVGGTSGIRTRGGDLAVTTNNGNLTVNRAIDTRVTPGSGATTTAGDVTLTVTAPSTADLLLNANVTGNVVTFVSPDAITIAPGVVVDATVNRADLAGEIWRGYNSNTTFNENLNGDKVVIYAWNGADITQAAGNTITANNLVFLTLGGDSVFNFSAGTNNVSTFSVGRNWGGLLVGSGAITLNSTGPLTVGRTVLDHYHGGAVSGIASGNQNVTLNTAGALALSRGINAGGGDVLLNTTTGGISQTSSGAITANDLGISSTGASSAVLLQTAANNVDALDSVSVAGSAFRFKEAGSTTVRNVAVTNAGAATVAVTAADSLSVTGTVSARSSNNSAPGTVTLTAGNGIDVSGSIAARGGGTGAGVNAGVMLTTTTAGGDWGGPINVTGSISAIDNGAATPAAAAPHSAQVTINANSRYCGFFSYPCGTASIGNITATSNQGRAVIDAFAQNGMTVSGPLRATGETRPLINLSTNLENSNQEIISSAPITIGTGGSVTSVSTSETAINTLPDEVTGGVSISGRAITIGGAIQSRHSNAALRAQEGITIDTRDSATINANVSTSSAAGIGISTGGNGTIQGPGVIAAQSVNFTAPKSQGTFNVKTRIEDPAGGGTGNLNTLGGLSMTVDNSAAAASSTLVSATGFINATATPPVDLPVGDLTLLQPGTLQIATLNNTNPNNSANPVSNITLVANDFIVIPGAITSMAATRVTIRPFTNTRNIIVGNTGTSDSSNLFLGTQLVGTVGTGLLQQFHRDATLVIGGPDHKANVTIAPNSSGLFTLGNMNLIFQTGLNGAVILNYFSVSPDSGGTPNSPYGPEPKIRFPGLGYPGSDYAGSDAESVSGIGRITSGKIQLIEANSFQPSPGVTIVGSCGASCPGGTGGGSTPVDPGTSNPGGGGGGGGGGSTPGGNPTGGTTTGTPGGTVTTTVVTTTTPPVITIDPTISTVTPDPTPPGVTGGPGLAVGDGGGTLSDPTLVATDGTGGGGGTGGGLAGDGTGGDGGGGGGTGGGLAGDGTGGDGTGGGGTGGGLAGDGTGGDGTGGGGTGGGLAGDGTGGDGAGGGGTGGGLAGDGTGGDGAGGGGTGGGLAGDGAGGDGAGGGGTGGGLAGDGAGGDGAGGGGTGGGLAGDGTGGDGTGGGGTGSGLAGDGTGGDGTGGGGTGGGLAGDGTGGGGTGGGLAGDGTGGGGAGDGLAGDGTGGGGAGGGLAGDGTGGGGAGGGLAGDGTGGGGTGGGLAGDGTGGGGTGGGLAGDGTGGGGTGGGLAGDGTGGGGTGGGLAGADATSGGTGGGLAGADATSGGTGGGLAGADATSGGTGAGLAGGDTGGGGAGGGFGGDGAGSGGTGGGIAGADTGGGGTGGGFPGADTTSGGTGGVIAGTDATSGATGGAIAGPDATSGGTGGALAGADATSGGTGGALAGDAGGVGGDGMGGGAPGGFGGDGTGGTGIGGVAGTDTTGGTGPLAGVDTTSGGTGGAFAGPDATSGGVGDVTSGDAGTAAGGTALAGGDAAGTAGDGISGGFTGGGAGGSVADAGGIAPAGTPGTGDPATGGEPGGTKPADGGSKEDGERYFEDERERRLRLVGGNPLISVEGDGVNLYRGDRGQGMGTPRQPAGK